MEASHSVNPGLQRIPPSFSNIAWLTIRTFPVPWVKELSYGISEEQDKVVELLDSLNSF